MSAADIFNQNDGEVTKKYYAELNAKGLLGQLACALFRAQKRSTAAKKYKRGKFTRAAYDVKNWSLSEICRVMGLLFSAGYEFKWGWKRDPNTPGYEWVLYTDLPTGQAAFHSADRLSGPDYAGEWKAGERSERSILDFCDSIMK